MDVTQYKPPIAERDTDELIEIANTTGDEWQADAIDQAKAELKNRGINKQQQQEIISEWAEVLERQQVEHEQQLKRNENESYSVPKMVFLFVVGPLWLIHKLFIDSTFAELKRQNYKRKYRQRLFLIISGTICWVLYGAIETNMNEKKRLEEIKKIDISDWKKAYYEYDSAGKK